MGVHREKELDDIIRTLVVDAGLEQPPSGLKKNIMTSIRRVSHVTTYRALIPLKGWVTAGLLLAALVGVVVWNPFDLKALSFDLLTWEVPRLTVAISENTTYALVVFGFLVLLQVYLLTRKIGNR